MIKLKESIPKDQIGKSIDTSRCSIYFEESRLNDKPYLLPLCILRTKPCFWIREGGGCAVCGYNLNTNVDHEFCEQDLLDQVKYITDHLSSQTYPFITVTSTGSFLDTKEVSDDTRRKILVNLKNAGFKYFNFECRPEFLLNKDKLREIVEIFPDGASVGIGLESSNDLVRNSCLNKGFKMQTFLNAAKACAETKVSYDTYILYGKPFLTERDNIKDAIDTIKFSFEHGATYAILMIANMQPYTLSHWLWKRGLYRLPKLWGIFDVFDALPKEYRSRIIVKGMNRAVPSPLFFSSNCEKCTPAITDAINFWNLTADEYHLENVREICTCKAEWKAELNRDEESLPDRIRKMYDLLSRELFSQPFQDENG